MAPVRLVHFVGAHRELGPLERFLASVRAHDAGVEYELLFVLNGFDHVLPRNFETVLATVEHKRLPLPTPMLDLAAYRMVVEQAGPDVICFTNSYVEIIADGWLCRLRDALDTPGVGLAGATGSWESAFSSAPAKLRLPRAVQFPRFPNPSIRTNTFAGSREVLLDLDWGSPQSKLEALRLESGRRSVTRQVAARGLRTVVVDRDGRTFDPPDWPVSATFRAGDQRGLLASDNRTRDYADADSGERRRLARMAWGRHDPGD